MSKIKVIEKEMEKLREFSIGDLSEIVGGTTYNCKSGAVLCCSPFKGSCMLVTIGDDSYACNPDSSLKKKCSEQIQVVIPTSTTADNSYLYQVAYFLIIYKCFQL